MDWYPIWLNRFDREKITVYQEERENPHSLPYNDIVFLEEDAEGNIWVGTVADWHISIVVLSGTCF